MENIQKNESKCQAILTVKSSSDIYKHLIELEGIQRSQQLQILKQKILF